VPETSCTYPACAHAADENAANASNTQKAQKPRAALKKLIEAFIFVTCFS
jgi:hypothetical protein